MKKQKYLIFLIIILVVALVFFFAFYSKNIFPLFQSDNDLDNNQERVIGRGDLNEAKIQIREMENELFELRELAEDQMSLAIVDQLFAEINFYKTEFEKPTNEIKKETIEDFYNSQIWESIIDLKNIIKQ